QLDAGNGLGSFAFQAPGAAARITWSDAIASERRLLTARFDDGTWNRPRVVATQVGGPTGRRCAPTRRTRTARGAPRRPRAAALDSRSARRREAGRARRPTDRREGGSSSARRRPL